MTPPYLSSGSSSFSENTPPTAIGRVVNEASHPSANSTKTWSVSFGSGMQNWQNERCPPRWAFGETNFRSPWPGSCRRMCIQFELHPRPYVAGNAPIG